MSKVEQIAEKACRDSGSINDAAVVGADKWMDDADAFIMERIAEADMRKIGERDKNNLLAEAVMGRLRELNGNIPADADSNESDAPNWQPRDDFKSRQLSKEIKRMSTHEEEKPMPRGKPVCPGQTERCRTFLLEWALRRMNANEAEDFRQEVCDHCLLGQPGFRREARFSTWLMRIMMNLHNDHLRAKRREKDGMELLAAFAEGGTGAWDDHLFLVNKVLAEISPEQRLILQLKFVEGRSHAEIAEQLEITVENSQIKLHRARRAFREVWWKLNSGE